MRYLLFLLTLSSLLHCADASPAVQSANDIRPLLLGSPLPESKLKNQEGEILTLQEIVNHQPSVIIFYRGGWCPFCNHQLADLQNSLADLKALGVQLLAISPDLPKNIQGSAEKLKLDYRVYSDSNMSTAKAFGIAFEVDALTLKKYATYGIDLEASSGEVHHLLPVPSVFLVNKEGKIEFSYVNPDYKTRLSSKVLLSAVQAMLDKK